MNLTDDQLNALDTFQQFIFDNDEKYMIIQGSSGTGKSTLIREMILKMHQNTKIYALLLQQDTMKWEPCITATTNKAANVLEEITKYNVCTIHSFLNLTLQVNYTTGKEQLVLKKGYNATNAIVYNKLIIVDEASFINPDLYHYLDTLTVNCKIILIGDQYQLAPVKQKYPIMANIITPHKAILSTIVRHTGHISSLGKTFKEAVKSGLFTPIQYNDLDIKHVDGPTFQDIIKDVFTAPDYTPAKARVLAWTNSRVLEYGKHIRELKGYSQQFNVDEYAITNKPCLTMPAISTDSEVHLSYVSAEYTQLDIPGRDIKLNSGTKKMFLPNDSQQVRVYLKRLAKEKDWKTYYKIKNEWLDLRSVYASTVHKSQGSEYEVVFLDLSDIGRCTIASDAARMLYVGITRATKQVILYGTLPPRLGGKPELVRS